MDVPWEIVPWLAAMILLIVGSAFFSASEAALFSLRMTERRQLAEGTVAQRMAEQLMQNPDRLLSAVLFWNLAGNMAYFAIAAIVVARWQGDGAVALGFSVGSLLTLIFLGEMLPKCFGVMRAYQLAEFVGVPLSIATRLLDPLMPILRTVNLLSRRLIWPSLEAQPYLEIADLERAIELSSSNRELMGREQAVLRNIVQLSELPVQEWMRPRKQFRSFRPPVAFRDLMGEMTPSGYLLVTEPDSDEIVSALFLPDLFDVPTDHLEHRASPVVYVPWCVTVADALELLQLESADVAAVINERGETIGIVTMSDIRDALFTESPERHERLRRSHPIQQISPNLWHVAGMTNLRLIERQFGIELPPNRNVTLAGVVQEQLEGHADVGDTCQWGPFRILVLSIGDDHQPQLQLELCSPESSVES